VESLTTVGQTSLTPSKTETTTEKLVTFDLKECPIVMEELVLALPEKRTGALIVTDGTRPPPASPARCETAISGPAASLKVTRRGQAFLTAPRSPAMRKDADHRPDL